MSYVEGVRVNLAQARPIFVGVSLLVLLVLGSAKAQVKSQLSPADLVKAVIGAELRSPDSQIRWKYKLDKEVDGKQEIKEVVETKFGSLDRLLATGGTPLTEARQHDETERLFRLSHSAQEQRKLEETHRKEAAQCNAFLQMIPEAFLFEFAGETGTLTKLIFRPNPRFQASSREGKVLREMAGEILLETKQLRLISINAHLINDVKFGGGLLGRLGTGGQFRVTRAEIAPGHWEVVELVVDMRGKALLFKTIAVRQKELHTNFQRVPDDLTLSEAAGLLLSQTLVAAQR